MATPQMAAAASGGSKTNFSDITGAIGDILGGGGSNSGSGSTVGQADSTQTADLFNAESLQTILAAILEQAAQFSPDAAAKDSADSSKLALEEVLKTYMPQLQQGAATSGMYDSTTQKMLEGDLASRAALQSSAQAQKVKQDYGQMFSAMQQLASQIAGQQTGSTSSQSQTQDTTSDSKQKKKGLVAGATEPVIKPISKGLTDVAKTFGLKF